ncbi:MAG: hypothetical protein ABJA83_14775, partial [Burkholderiaceae bacterium]
MLRYPPSRGLARACGRDKGRRFSAIACRRGRANDRSGSYAVAWLDQLSAKTRHKTAILKADLAIHFPGMVGSKK